MLGFKRVCRDAWTGLNGLACNVLMQVTCNSGFLPMGEEMHFLFVCSRLPPVPVSPLSPGPAFSWFCVFPGVIPVSSLYGLSAWPTRPGTGPRARVIS